MAHEEEEQKDVNEKDMGVITKGATIESSRKAAKAKTHLVVQLNSCGRCVAMRLCASICLLRPNTVSYKEVTHGCDDGPGGPNGVLNPDTCNNHCSFQTLSSRFRLFCLIIA